MSLYNTKVDLLNTMVSYFKAGLENNEFCIWVVSESLAEEEARNALRQAVPYFDQCETEHALEMLSGHDWYFKQGIVDLKSGARGWKAALERGDDEGALIFARKLCGLPEKHHEAPAQEMRIPVFETNFQPPSPPSPVLAVSLEEAARLLSLSVYTVRAWRRKGLIKVVRFGRQVLISTAELQRLATEGLPDAT